MYAGDEETNDLMLRGDVVFPEMGIAPVPWAARMALDREGGVLKMKHYFVSFLSFFSCTASF